jgi:putative peptide zinc metalloprotease protein
MKTLSNVLLAAAIVASVLVAGPAVSRAQSPPDSPTATATATIVTESPVTSTATPLPAVAPEVTPTPAPATAPDPAATAPTPSAAEDPQPDDPLADEIVVREEAISPEADDRRGAGFGPGRNVVSVLNRSDGRMRMRSRVRLVHINGERAEPVNAAFAYASCTDCQTFAVALEIALISPSASVIAPQNRARAINYECTRCVTVARALQYAYVVDDPQQVPDNVRRLLREMEAELREIGRTRDITPAEANGRISAVLARFQELNVHLRDELAQSDEPTSPGAPPPAEAVPAPTEPQVQPASQPTATPSPSPAPSGG